jgi:hypothetical protein
MDDGQHSQLCVMTSHRTCTQYVHATGESSDPKGSRHQQDREHDRGVLTAGRDGQMGRKGIHLLCALACLKSAARHCIFRRRSSGDCIAYLMKSTCVN